MHLKVLHDYKSAIEMALVRRCVCIDREVGTMVWI